MSEQELLKKDAIIKDIQQKLLLLRNALIEERKKSTRLDEKNKELTNKISYLEKLIISKETEITNLTRDTLDLQEAISLEKSKSEDQKNVFSQIFQKEGNAITDLENKKLQTTINDLQIENDKITKENEEIKKYIEQLTISSDNKINELNIQNKNLEINVEKKNNQIDEVKKRFEVVQINDNENTNEKNNLKNKFAELENENKVLRDDIEKYKLENNEQNETLNLLEKKALKIIEENLNLMLKMNQVSDNVAEDRIVKQKFICEKKGKNKCEITFGPNEDNKYIMLITDYYNRTNENIYIENIDSVKIYEKDKLIEICLDKNYGNKKIYFNSDIEILKKIEENFKQYKNIVKKLNESLTNMI